MLRQAQFLGEQFERRQAAFDDVARRGDMRLRRGERAQVALAGDEDVFGLMPAGDAQQFPTQQVDAGAGTRRQRNGDRVGLVVALGGAAGEVDLVVYRDPLQAGR